VNSQEVVITTSDGRRRFTIDDDFCDSSGVSAANRETVKVFICAWLALLSDSPLDPLDGPKPFRNYRKFLEEFRVSGFKATVLRYSDLAHRLAKQAYLYGTSSFNDEFIDDFRGTPIFLEYHRYYKSEDPSLFQYLYTVLTFGKKLPYIDPEFEKTAFRGWLDLEAKLSTWSYEDSDLGVLKCILETLLPPLSLNGFYPKFGPKAVSERKVLTRIHKVEAFKYDSVIDRHIFGGSLGHYGFGEDHGLTPARAIPNLPAWGKKEVTSTRTARLRFVPKDLKTSRSICMEPSVLQFFQQGVWDRIEYTLTKTPFKRWIRFSDQSYNQSLATFGSGTGEIDTIDLSSASDCVSLALIKGIFPRSWQIAMRATRSDKCILPDGSLHNLTKFAPMGSALCFPTQSLIFAAVCIYAALVYQHQVTGVALLKVLTKPLVMEAASAFKKTLEGMGAFEPLGIYGDDICIDRRLTDEVIDILHRLGFRVNHGKSFRGSQAFRESCGAFALNGHRVDPMYYRVDFQGKHTAYSLESMVALSNECYMRDYVNLRRFLIKHLLHTPIKGIRTNCAKNPILFVAPHDDSFGIKTDYPMNGHLKGRTNKGYQREEWKSIGISEEWRVRDKNLVTDSYSLMRWMASRRYASSVPIEGTHDVHTGGARVVWRWTPTTE
jgi:hypothetical protein